MALEATPDFGPHLPEETLEQYAFGRLPAGELEAVEQHLLLCERCRNRLESEDDFAEAMWMLAQIGDPPGSSSLFERCKTPILTAAHVLSRPAYAAALAVILAGGFFVWRLLPGFNQTGFDRNAGAEAVMLSAL